jgi:hypothetical protein
MDIVPYTEARVLVSGFDGLTAKQRANRRWYLRNKDKKIAAMKARYAADPVLREKRSRDAKKYLAEHPEKRREYIRASQTKRRYGLDRAQHKALFDSQNGCCAICRVEQTAIKRRFCIDHNHATGEVRQLLCHHCNGVLGHARENKDILRAAIFYLEKHGE